MSNKNTIEIRLEVRDDGTVKIREFSKEAKGRMDDVEGSAKKLSSGLTSMTGVVVSLATAYGIKGLAGSFIAAADAAEQYQTRLTVLLRSEAEGVRLAQEMTAYAGKVPHTYQDIMESATQLSGIMSGGVEQIKQWMPLIGDLAAATGLSIQQTTEQVSRMYSAGAASADLFRERGVLAMLGFQAGVTYSAEETRRGMMEAWNKADSQFRGATDKLAETWQGKISMMEDAWFTFSEGFGRLITTKMEPHVALLTKALGFLATKIQTMADEAQLGAEAEKWERAFQSSSGWIGKARGALGDLYSTLASWSEKSNAYLYAESEQRKQIIELIKEQEAWNLYAAGGVAGGATTFLPGSGGGAGSDEQEKLKEELWAWELEKALEHDEAMIAGHEAMRAYEQEQKQQAIDEQKRLKEELWAWELEKALEHDDALIAAHGAMRNYEVADANEKKRQEELKRQAIGNTLNYTIMTGKLLMQTSLGQNRAVFAITKAASIASATVNTYDAAVAAYKAMAGIPVVGPALGAAAAAAAVAFGMAQVHAIMAQSFDSATGGGGGGAGVPVTSATTAPVYDTYSSPQTEDGEEKRGVVNIYVQGDLLNNMEFAENLAERLSQLVENRDVRLVASTAKTIQ